MFMVKLSQMEETRFCAPNLVHVFLFFYSNWVKSLPLNVCSCAMYGRIDENMEETVANVEGAQGQLLKYLNSISSNRWLMMKIFFVLMVFLMIFIFFVA